MPEIVLAGSLNLAAIVVPDVIVQIVPPQQLNLNGVPSGIAGIVGTASWGPLNSPVIVASHADYVRSFGPVRVRKHDAGTLLACAVQQGAQDFRVVRVSDGSDVAASATLADRIAFTALYTGTLGNSVQVAISAGARADTLRAVVGVPGVTPEVYDNLPSGTAFWAALAAAVTFGVGVARGSSLYLSAEADPDASVAPVAGTVVTLAGGTDGADVEAADLVGSDADGTGMYALRGQDCALLALADADDATQWSLQAAFGISESAYVIATGPAGDSISAAVARKRTAGVDSFALKVMHGDWLYWNDQTNGVTRLVSPQGFVVGRLANLSPEQSSLNKTLYGIVGSQRSGIPGSGQSRTYSKAELQALFQAGIDVVTNPIPRGAVWGVRAGHNSSTEPSIQGDNYPRMTNFLSRTLAAGMGVYSGEPITDEHLLRVRSTLMTLLSDMKTSRQLKDYSVRCDDGNNPNNRTSQGYVVAEVQAQYLAINERFIVNLEGGQTVSVVRTERTSA